MKTFYLAGCKRDSGTNRKGNVNYRRLHCPIYVSICIENGISETQLERDISPRAIFSYSKYRKEFATRILLFGVRPY